MTHFGNTSELSHTQHPEDVLEDWIESNSDGIIEDGKLLVIGCQFSTDLGSFIDSLALDRLANLVVAALKREGPSKDTLAQPLEYVSFAPQLPTHVPEGILQSYNNEVSRSLVEHHRAHFDLARTRLWH